jgi:hypothetical protein
MQPDVPRTITFNATPIDEAQHRSARLGALIVGRLVGIPALLCLAVAGSYNLWWAVNVGASFGEKITLSLISLALTGCVGGLPVASVLLASAYPAASRQAMSIWSMALWISAFSAFYFTATRDWAAAGAPDPGTSIAWVTAGMMDERQTRAFFTLLFALAALAGGGLLLRLSVLASAESWRLGTGQARWAPETAMATTPETPQALAAVASQTPEEIFGLWANSRLKLAQGNVQGMAAFEDYKEACRLTGVAALSMTKFGTLMTARAATMEGRVIKSKSNGNIIYQGWVLVGSADDVPESREGRLPVEAPRGDQPVIPLFRRR